MRKTFVRNVSLAAGLFSTILLMEGCDTMDMANQAANQGENINNIADQKVFHGEDGVDTKATIYKDGSMTIEKSKSSQQNSSAVFCTYCGKQFPDSAATFCPYCGHARQ